MSADDAPDALDLSEDDLDWISRHAAPPLPAPDVVVDEPDFEEAEVVELELATPIGGPAGAVTAPVGYGQARQALAEALAQRSDELAAHVIDRVLETKSGDKAALALTRLIDVGEPLAKAELVLPAELSAAWIQKASLRELLAMKELRQAERPDAA